MIESVETNEFKSRKGSRISFANDDSLMKSGRKSEVLPETVEEDSENGDMYK